MISFFQFFVDAYNKLVQAKPKTPPPNPPTTGTTEVCKAKKDKIKIG